MATATTNDCTQLDSTLLERVNYFPRQLLTADDMTADQQYFINKLRRHNRYLHGWGVVCGLAVTVSPTTATPWQVVISPGYALGPYGDEIYVPDPFNLDLAQCGPGAATDPCAPGSLLLTGIAKTGSTIFIAIRYEECLSRPVRVLAGGCGCNDSSCEPSRISDSYEISCLSDLPPSSQQNPGPAMCDILSGRVLAQCPPCPSDPWVVLAQVQLPGTAGAALAQGNIDNITVRRMLFSTATIQQQVQLCCCAGNDIAPVRVTSINPADGTVFTNGSQVPGAILITFNKHLVSATANTNTILVLLTQPGVPSKAVQGLVTYDDGTQSATFAPAQPFTIPGTYQVTVVGSGPSFITDSDNLALDGNADGTAGGNFLSQFTVQGVVTTPTPTPTPSQTPTPTVTPTPSSDPIKVVLRPSGSPVIPRSAKAGATGELALMISGGAAGQKVVADITVILSANIGSTSAADTAVLASSEGNVNATKAGNSYTFTGVVIVLPGSTGSFTIKIGKMKINATSATGAGAIPVMANVSIATTPGDPLLTPTPAAVQVASIAQG